jgi:hypothetical protein
MPGASAQVTVPACCGPVAAAGIVPNAPPGAVDGAPLPLPVLPLVHATSIVAPAKVSAAIMTVGRATLIIALYLSWCPADWHCWLARKAPPRTQHKHTRIAATVARSSQLTIGSHRQRSRTSGASPSASPMKLQAITVAMMQNPTG